MNNSRDWLGENDADEDTPLAIVKALPPGETEGIMKKDGRYDFQLVLNRPVDRYEQGVVESNPFDLKLRAERKTIFVSNSTLDEIDKLGVRLNDYLKEESRLGIIYRNSERNLQDKADREREEKAAILAEQARSIKFTE